MRSWRPWFLLIVIPRLPALPAGCGSEEILSDGVEGKRISDS